MCGRYYVDDGTIRAIQNMIPGTEPMSQEKRCGDICPSCTAFVITGRTPQLSIETMSWGFPQYQKKGLVINARAETVLERKMFRDSILHRRCIIPARQYYEWDADRNKVTFSRKEQPVIYMAGCFDRFQDKDRFVILTTRANESVSPVHDRMPLILDEGELEPWVYDNAFLEFALRKTPARLEKSQEYEQQTLF